MSEKVVQHELHVYRENEPFRFYELIGDGTIAGCAGGGNDQELVGQGLLFEHWHEDLEFCYYWARESSPPVSHHINGELVAGTPGRLIATNSTFIHNIMPPPNDSREIMATILLIKPEFLRENLPEYEYFYFTNGKEKASPQMQSCVEKIHAYIKNMQETDCAHLYGKSLVLEFLYLAVQEGIIARDEVSHVNVEKDLERMKGIISYIGNHYREPISQAEIAKKFYFCGTYFSKYFKQCTGMTFSEYLSRYRVEKARHDLLVTEKCVTEIALDNGFSDSRRMILHFKRYFGMTPLQYRKLKK
jgi:AraC-like DNA-binding protein